VEFDRRHLPQIARGSKGMLRLRPETSEGNKEPISNQVSWGLRRKSVKSLAKLGKEI
jgi:hypothetical protein